MDNVQPTEPENVSAAGAVTASVIGALVGAAATAGANELSSLRNSSWSNAEIINLTPFEFERHDHRPMHGEVKKTISKYLRSPVSHSSLVTTSTNSDGEQSASIDDGVIEAGAFDDCVTQWVLADSRDMKEMVLSFKSKDIIIENETGAHTLYVVFYVNKMPSRHFKFGGMLCVGHTYKELKDSSSNDEHNSAIRDHIKEYNDPDDTNHFTHYCDKKEDIDLELRHKQGDYADSDWRPRANAYGELYLTTSQGDPDMTWMLTFKGTYVNSDGEEVDWDSTGYQ